MEFRFLISSDAEEWRRLRSEALEGDPDAFSASVEEHRLLSSEDIKGRLGNSAGDSFVLGAFEDNRLIGMAGFHRERGLKSRHKGRVWGVYVTPQKRGQKVGRQILEKLLDRVAEIKGVDQVILSVTKTQDSALALYRSLGFESFGCEPRALKINGRLIDEEYMILLLDGLSGPEKPWHKNKKAP